LQPLNGFTALFEPYCATEASTPVIPRQKAGTR